jgi:prephenate dehydrogenase
MKKVYMNSKDHDRHTAWISHLPHIISYSLANTVLAQERVEDILNLSAGGFRDMSRLAKSSPDMWVDIVKQNRSNLIYTIEYFQKELELFREAIEKEDWDTVKSKMEAANILHKIL